MDPKRDPPFFLSLISATARELKTKVKPSLEADALVSIGKFNQGVLYRSGAMRPTNFQFNLETLSSASFVRVG